MEEKKAESQPQPAAQELSSPRKYRFPEGFPSAVDYLVFLGIFLLSQLAGAVVAWIGVGWPDFELLKSADLSVADATQHLVGRFNAVTYITSMSLTLLGFLFYRSVRRGRNVMPRFSLRGLNPVLLLWGILLVGAVSVVIEPLMALLPEVPDVYGRGFWTFVTLVVAAPLFEEVIFRGIILESTRLRYGVVAAWLVSSLIFGVVHMNPAVVVNAAIMGLILGFIYLASGSLWPAIILHAFNNATSYLLLLGGHMNKGLADLIQSPTLYTVVYICALAVSGVSGWMVWRTIRRLREEEKNPSEA